MGKGNRNRELRLAANDGIATSGAKLSKLQLIRKQERADAIKRWATLIAIIAIIVGIVLALVISSYKSSVLLTKTVAGTSEDYEINDAMVAYFMYYEYQTLYSYYSSYLSSLGLDTSTSLQSQSPNSMAELYLGYSSSYTWYQNFMSNAISSLNQYVALAEEATDKGYALDDDDYATIDETLDDIKSAAKTNGYTVNEYLSSMFAEGVKIDTVKACLELQTLASKYYNILVDSYSFTEEEELEYANENKSSFYTFDYIMYSYTAEYEDEADDTIKAAERTTAKEKAEALYAMATDEDAFKAAIVELEKAIEAEEATEEAADETEESEDSTETEEKTDEDYLDGFVVEDASYSSTESDFNTWAFSDERKAGDITMIQSDDEDTFTVYMITETLHLDTTATRSVRHILIEATEDNTEEEIEVAEAKAADILNNEFNTGDMTEESFAALAEKYSTDTGSNTNGGLYEDVTEGEMVDEFNDWLFDSERKVGDTGIVQTDYGYHIMYYVGEGLVQWRVDAEDALTSEKYSEDLEALETAHAVTWNEDNLALIP